MCWESSFSESVNFDEEVVSSLPGDEGMMRIAHRGALTKQASLRSSLPSYEPTFLPSYSKIRAVGSGHHRNWTLPMMYFFGTSPQ
jgi:hypothetical protein